MIRNEIKLDSIHQNIYINEIHPANVNVACFHITEYYSKCGSHGK